jgi:integrase
VARAGPALSRTSDVDLGSGAALDSPATALWRIVGSLSPTQAQSFAHEIELLAAATIPQRRARAAKGVRTRHSRWCPSGSGAACTCSPRWEAWVYSRKDRAKIRKTFGEYWEAKAWRHEQLELAGNGLLYAPSHLNLDEVAAVWIAMAHEGRIRNRSGRRYKPSALRTIEQDLRRYLVPSLGAKRMTAIGRGELQRLVGAWLDKGLSPSKVRSIVNAARVLWRDFDLLTDCECQLLIDPTHGLRLPANTPRPERIAGPAEARRLIEALDQDDRALWATAMYAGLRHGELRALQVRDIDLERRRIHVRRGWDQYEGEITPKSMRGDRLTIITRPLERLLLQHLKDTRRTGSDLIFGSTSVRPFDSTALRRRARRAWAVARQREADHETVPAAELMRPIGLHECRHTAVSHMLDAGLPAEKVSKFIGHASIAITIDRYGHLLPAGEAQATALLDAYYRRRQ